MTQREILEAYQKMLLIRRAEEAISTDFIENKIFSFYHSSAGQEAVSVGVCMALSKEDRVFGNHRSHGHYLAKGGDLYAMMCEIYGKADGCCKGYGGSMHMLDRSVGFMGSTPILGSAVPIALGSAFEQKVSGKNSITVVFTGDGASEEGVVYESLNIAATKGLPLLVVIEDNLYAVNTPASARRSPWFSREAVYTGLGACFMTADGNNIVDVLNAARSAKDTILMLRTQVVLHTTPFRHMAHSGPIAEDRKSVV